jgi:hypothetical protein
MTSPIEMSTNPTIRRARLECPARVEIIDTQDPALSGLGAGLPQRFCATLHLPDGYGHMTQGPVIQAFGTTARLAYAALEAKSAVQGIRIKLEPETQEGEMAPRAGHPGPKTIEEG